MISSRVIYELHIWARKLTSHHITDRLKADGDNRDKQCGSRGRSRRDLGNTSGILDLSSLPCPARAWVLFAQATRRGVRSRASSILKEDILYSE